jgi:hypothetical protein
LVELVAGWQVGVFRREPYGETECTIEYLQLVVRSVIVFRTMGLEEVSGSFPLATESSVEIDHGRKLASPPRPQSDEISRIEVQFRMTLLPQSSLWLFTDRPKTLGEDNKAITGEAADYAN